MTHPRQPAYDAVFDIIRNEPSSVTENARVWRAVEAALDAMATPKDDQPTGLRMRGEHARIGSTSGHGHAWSRLRAKCGGPGMCDECAYDQQLVEESRRTP